MSENSLIERWNGLQIQPVFENLTCVVCNSTYSMSQFKQYKSQDRFHAGELVRYECPSCNVIFGDLRFLNLSLDEIGKDYTDLYSYCKEGDTSIYILKILDKLNLGKNKVYLDFACGERESTLTLLNDNNYNVYGHDAYAFNSHPKFLEKINDEIKYDVVYSSNYIEHVIDPYKNLAVLVNLLNDNGKLVMMSPCWEYSYDYTHYHTFFFLGKSVEYLCKNLNIKEIYSEKIIFEDGEWTIIKIFEKNT